MKKTAAFLAATFVALFCAVDSHSTIVNDGKETGNGGNFFVYNNTAATLALDTSSFKNAPPLLSTIQPMSSAGAPSVNLSNTETGGVSGSLSVTIQGADGAPSYRFGFDVSFQEVVGKVNWMTWTLNTQGDTSWNTTNGAAASSGSVAITCGSDTYCTGRINQMWNSEYVVSLFEAIDDDKCAPSNQYACGTAQIVLLVEPNPNSVAYVDAVDTLCPSNWPMLGDPDCDPPR